jgi:hypothetical protein
MAWQWHVAWIAPTGLLVAYLFLGTMPKASGQEDCIARARSVSEVEFCNRSSEDYRHRRAGRDGGSSPGR